MDSKFLLTIPLTWHFVRQVREAIYEALEGYGRAAREAAAMTGTELVENAIKYGEVVPAMGAIEVSMTSTDAELVILVANGCRDPRSVDTLRSHIERVQRATDRELLYVQRLQELLANPEDAGKLGLYRIGFEGQFDLSCEYNHSVVRTTARKGNP